MIKERGVIDLGRIGYEIYFQFGVSELSVSSAKKLLDILLMPGDFKLGDFNGLAFSTLKKLIDTAGEDYTAEKIKDMPYKHFLKTGYWRYVSREVKNKVKDSDGRRTFYLCEGCNAVSEKVMNVHHTTYENHGYEATKGFDDLVCLCRDCHRMAHGYIDENATAIEYLLSKHLGGKYIRGGA